MLIGCIADDFTGAGDLANTLAREGMAARQYVGVPDGPADPACEAGVVALKTRSVPAAEAVAQSLAAARWLAAQGCRQFLFKYCSTFDSTPDGNIGPVAEALLDELGADLAVVCPAFPANGRRVFMGHLFVGEALLSDSPMRHHPLTPMTDPDLRRWLSRQTGGHPVGLVRHGAVREGPEAIGAALAREAAAGHRLVVVDATEEADLRAIGAALHDHRLVTGGSGIALGLPDNFRRAGLLGRQPPVEATAGGPAVVLCGSCSAASQRQVEVYAAENPSLRVEPGALMSGTTSVERVLGWVGEQGERRAPIVYSSAAPEHVAAAQRAHGQAAVAARLEGFFAALASGLVAHGRRRIVVGGGETSGAVVEALGIRSLGVGAEIDPGVPALLADGPRPLALALKSGNFGAPDFFQKAVRHLERP